MCSLFYSVDYTFGKEQQYTQAIYDEVGSPIIEAVMKGYNGTIFAYGQTASGTNCVAIIITNLLFYVLVSRKNVYNDGKSRKSRDNTDSNYTCI